MRRPILPDARTLSTGAQMANRRFVVADDSGKLPNCSRNRIPFALWQQTLRSRILRVFLFGGQGTQYVNHGLNLCDEPLFRAVVAIAATLKPHLGRIARTFTQAETENPPRSASDTFYHGASICDRIRRWLFLAEPGRGAAMMAGHSIGEFVRHARRRLGPRGPLSIIALPGRLCRTCRVDP